MWPSWLGRQIVALKVMGSNPIIHPIYAGMAELADALDLGSSVIDVGVQVLFPAPLLLWVVVKKVEFLGSTFFLFKFKKEVIMKKIVNIEKTDSNFKDYILFDIETTGLNRTKDFMYMFGICEKKDKNLIYSQYYIEDEAEEKELILKVNELLNTKKVISYNGDRFDFPFIRKKMEKYNISKVDFENIDIYRQLQKLNFFLDEPSLKAINLGKRLGFDVHDHVNQQEMPKIFKMYQELKDKEMLSKLIYHNYIDLQVLSYIYEYKESILNKILTINNKKFTGILKTIYIQKNYLITRLSNLKNIDINFHQSNYSIMSNKDEIKISENLFEKNEEKAIFNLGNELELLENKEFANYIQVLLNNANVINNYFDNVIINADDETIKNNRVSTLKKLEKSIDKMINI